MFGPAPVTSATLPSSEISISGRPRESTTNAHTALRTARCVRLSPVFGVNRTHLRPVAGVCAFSSVSRLTRLRPPVDDHALDLRVVEDRLGAHGPPEAAALVAAERSADHTA